MTYSCHILADSQGPNDVRLTTFEITYPRFVHSELMTHRVFSRNAASSRAIPIDKMIQQVEQNPAMPVWWGKNQSGMQAQEELNAAEKMAARCTWLAARDEAVLKARELQRIGAHKQIVNRLIEPWMWITVLVTATEWANFFALRNHEDAQPEIREIARTMEDVYNSTTPRRLRQGDWHMPLMDDLEQLKETFSESDICLIAVGRCARVSYLTHAGVRDPKADLALAQRLQDSGHMSPFEHLAQALHRINRSFYGNLRGWMQFRKLLPDEEVWKRPE